jgi:hypothetical protein
MQDGLALEGQKILATSVTERTSITMKIEGRL